jgi:tryptophanase
MPPHSARASPGRREEGKARAALEDCELKAEALTLALDSAFDERARLIEQNRSGWRRQSMRELAKAQTRYTDAIH